MEAFKRFVKNISERGGHRVIFSSKYQFCQWYKLFATGKEKYNEVGVVDEDINKVI